MPRSFAAGEASYEHLVLRSGRAAFGLRRWVKLLSRLSHLRLGVELLDRGGLRTERKVRSGKGTCWEVSLREVAPKTAEDAMKNSVLEGGTGRILRGSLRCYWCHAQEDLSEDAGAVTGGLWGEL